MSNRFPVNELRPLMEGVVWAIHKGIDEDVRDYLSKHRKETNNAILLMRGDNINENLRNFVVSDSVELKHFRRYAWDGCLLIDRKNKVTITICTKQTLERIPKQKNRSVPHYLQSILFVQNGDLEAPVKQMHLSDFVDIGSSFTADEYEDDYKSIMEDEINFDDGYRHCVVIYETLNYEIKSIAMRFLDRDFNTVVEESLMDLLKPNFANLTSDAIDAPDIVEEDDVHKLVSLKPGLKRQSDEPRVEISTKKIEEGKQA